MQRLTVEEAIQEAQKEGKFSNLPGKGKPLNLDPSPDAVVNGLLREANVKPEWIEVAREIELLQAAGAQILEEYALQHAAGIAAIMDSAVTAAQPDFGSSWRAWWRRLIFGSSQRQVDCSECERFNRSWEATLRRYASILHRTNARIRRFNDIVPGLGRQRPLIDVGQLLNEFAVRFVRVQVLSDRTEAVRGHIDATLLEPPVEQKGVAVPRDLHAGQIIHHVRRAKRGKRCL